MKKYTSKQNDDLGSIAARAGLPSWKYLYEINKSKIGDNPDLLKAGTELEIPEWDSTTGDEKIEAKGVSAFDYTGGAKYRYPWVPMSVSLVNKNEEPYKEKDEKGNEKEDYQKEMKYCVYVESKDRVIAEGSIKKFDELGLLVVDSKKIALEIDGFDVYF
jgi:hypothetical protein